MPVLTHAADTCNFADEFTRMPPTDSPAQAPKHHDKLFLGKYMLQLLFRLSRQSKEGQFHVPNNCNGSKKQTIYCPILKNNSPMLKMLNALLKTKLDLALLADE